MKTATKVILGVVGVGALAATGVVVYAIATDPKRREGASGDPVRRNNADVAAGLLDISRAAAQAYRDNDTGGGGAGDGNASVHLYDAAGGYDRGTGGTLGGPSQYS